jgi:hypothetical protein
VNNFGLEQMYLRFAAFGKVEAAFAQDGVSSHAKSSRKFSIMTDSAGVVMHQVILLPNSTPNFGLDLCEEFQVGSEIELGRFKRLNDSIQKFNR